MSKNICEEHGRIRCDICAYISELKEQASIAELAYQGLADMAVTRGEYQSLLDKHTTMTKAYRAEKERADKMKQYIARMIEADDILFHEPIRWKDTGTKLLASLYSEEVRK